MTRVLSELLGAEEPGFSLGLRQLENSAGRPNADIRLSTEILHGMQSKLRELGLDPHDTQGSELYAMLGARLRDDEQRFAAALKGKSTKTDDPIAHVAKALNKSPMPKSCFALKNTVAKRLIKANLPKKTMKQLGYRSADSMLKHESAASLYAAAALIEPETWAKKQLASYGKLKPSDFEIRDINVEHPTAKRWQTLAETVIAARKHNIFSFKELGTVVLLPLPSARPELPTLTSAVLSLHAINDIRAAGAYLKLHQVKSGFGAIVKQVVSGDPILHDSLLDQPVSWSMVQHYYGRFKESLREDIFEPVLQAEDLMAHSIEEVLAHIEPQLSFWENTAHLAMLDNGKPVSCNLTDQVLSHCNGLPFESRSLDYFKQILMTELTIRYMNADKMEHALSSAFQRQLAPETTAA